MNRFIIVLLVLMCMPVVSSVHVENTLHYADGYSTSQMDQVWNDLSPGSSAGSNGGGNTEPSLPVFGPTLGAGGVYTTEIKVSGTCSSGSNHILFRLYSFKNTINPALSLIYSKPNSTLWAANYPLLNPTVGNITDFGVFNFSNAGNDLTIQFWIKAGASLTNVTVASHGAEDMIGSGANSCVSGGRNGGRYRTLYQTLDQPCLGSNFVGASTENSIEVACWYQISEVAPDLTLSCEAITSPNRNVLTWVPTDGLALGYNISKRNNLNDTPIIIPLGNVLTYSDGGSTKVRYYSVHAWNTIGNGTESNIVSCQQGAMPFLGEGGVLGNTTQIADSMFGSTTEAAKTAVNFLLGLLLVFAITAGITWQTNTVVGAFACFASAAFVTFVGWWPAWVLIFTIVIVVAFAIVLNSRSQGGEEV